MTKSDCLGELIRLLGESPIAIPCGAESLLGLLYDAYFETQGASSTEIKEGFRTLYSHIKQLNPKDQEEIIDTVSTLCMEHECSGFINGVKLGFQLNRELSE